MTEGPLHRLALPSAITLLGSMRRSQCPGTLHPLYVEADARRNTSLQPAYLAYQEQGETWFHALHLSQVPGTAWWDASSPYGYGGPLSTSDDPGFLHRAWQAYVEWMRAHSVVVEYVRFHPLLSNDRFYGGHVLDNRQVVSIDLSTSDPASGYATRLRQVLRKSARHGLIYEEIPLAGRVGTFGAYYRAAMRVIDADPFYLFGDAYFQSLADSGMARLGLCTHPDHGSDWLAACLLLDGQGVREYHLAATTEKGRPFGASTHALHGAVQQAHADRMSQFFLGGGTDRQPDNSLLFFKSAFSPLRLAYRTGWCVFLAEGYEALKQRFPGEFSAHPERPIFYRKV